MGHYKQMLIEQQEQEFREIGNSEDTQVLPFESLEENGESHAQQGSSEALAGDKQRGE